MAKKGCIVRIYAGGLFSSGRDLYIVSGQDGALIEVIVTPPSDGGPVTAAGYDFHDAVDLEVTKATYKRYLAHAKKNPASTRGKMSPTDLPPPIPGMEGPFRYKTGFVLYWDPKEGQYYDRGKDMYLSIEEVEAAMGTKNPIPNKGPLRRRTATRDWIGKAITRPGKLGGAGFLSKSKAAQEKILRGCVAEYGYRSCLGSVMILERIPHLQARWGTRLAGLRHYLVRNFGGPGSFGPRSNPGEDFALVPEVSGCPLCMVKPNPSFEKELTELESHLDEERGTLRILKKKGANRLALWSSEADIRGLERAVAKKKASRPRKNPKKNASAVLRNAMRGT